LELVAGPEKEAGCVTTTGKMKGQRSIYYLTICSVMTALLFACCIAIISLEMRLTEEIGIMKEVGRDLIRSRGQNELLNEIGDAEARTIGQLVASCNKKTYCRRLPALECICSNLTDTTDVAGQNLES
jgi:hypothetical protein